MYMFVDSAQTNVSRCLEYILDNYISISIELNIVAKDKIHLNHTSSSSSLIPSSVSCFIAPRSTFLSFECKTLSLAIFAGATHRYVEGSLK